MNFLPAAGMRGTIAERLLARILYLFGTVCDTFMPNNPAPDYLAYLVRLWRSAETGRWRVLVQDPHSNQQLRFDSVEGLYHFLQEQSGESPRVSTPTPASTTQFVESKESTDSV